MATKDKSGDDDHQGKRTVAMMTSWMGPMTQCHDDDDHDIS